MSDLHYTKERIESHHKTFPTLLTEDWLTLYAELNTARANSAELLKLSDQMHELAELSRQRADEAESALAALRAERDELKAAVELLTGSDQTAEELFLKLEQATKRAEKAEQALRAEESRHAATSEVAAQELQEYRKGEATALLLADALTGMLRQIATFDAEFDLYPARNDCGAPGRWLVMRDKLRALLARPEKEQPLAARRALTGGEEE